MADPYGVYL